MNVYINVYEDKAVKLLRVENIKNAILFLKYK